MGPYEKESSRGLNAAVAAALRAEKAAAGMTNRTLAERSSITVASVQRYLAADRHIDVNVLDALAQALQTTPNRLIQAAQERMTRSDELAAAARAEDTEAARLGDD